MDNRLAACEELMRTVEKLRASLEASKTGKKEQEERKKEEQEERIRVNRALQKPLFEENRLLNALRNRGARVFKGGGFYCLRFADETTEQQWEEVCKSTGSQSPSTPNLAGNYGDYRVICEKITRETRRNNICIGDGGLIAEKPYEIVQDPGYSPLFYLRQRVDNAILALGSPTPLWVKEEGANIMGTYASRVFRTVFAKTLQSVQTGGNFDDLGDAWLKATERNTEDLMLLLPGKNYLKHFEKYEKAFGCTVGKPNVIPYNEEIPEAEYGFIFSPQDVHIRLGLSCEGDTRALVEDFPHYGWMLTEVLFSHTDRIVRFRCPPDET